jgi:RecA-family ATPase
VSEYGVHDGEELIRTDEKDFKIPIIENFLHMNEAVIVQGKGGIGKSTLMQQMAFNLTTASPFLGDYHITRPHNTVLIQLEGSMAELKDRVRDMVHDIPINTDYLKVINEAGAQINTDKGMMEIYNKLIHCKAKFKNGGGIDCVILDCFYASIKGKASDDDVASDWVRNMRMMLGEIGHPGLIVLHHPGKDHRDDKGKPVERSPEDLFGSYVWNAFFPTIYLFKKYSNRKNDNKRILIAGKRRDTECVSEIDLMFNSEYRYYEKFIPDATAYEGKIISIIKEKDGKATRRVILNRMDEFTVSESTVDNALMSLVRTGRIFRYKENGRPIYKLQEDVHGGKE